jgi:GNAT superfamily N-acetyltransferase
VGDRGARGLADNGTMRTRSLGYQTDLAIRIAEGSTVTDCGDHVIVRTDQNPRYWWGNFLLLAAPPRASEMASWLERFAAVFPGAGHRVVGVDVADAAEVDDAVFAAAGLAADRGVVLSAQAVRAPPHLHSAAVIRPLAGRDDWRQSGELTAACAVQDPVPEDEEFARLRAAARRCMAEAGAATWFGAFVGGHLVAQLGQVPLPGRLARFQDVETHPAARRQGLAGTLVWTASRFGLDTLGAARLVIVADPGSAGHRVYQSVGFAATEDHIGFVRPP